jgi:hypothetical protein
MTVHVAQSMSLVEEADSNSAAFAVHTLSSVCSIING